MTLIECYTDLPIHNIAACLRLHPEKLVFVGDGEKIHQQKRRYEKILHPRGLRPEITVCDTHSKDFDEIRASMERILNSDDSCVIDLTGGDEPVIMALGGALAKLSPERRKKVQVQRLDLATQTVHDCLNDNRLVPGKLVCLSIEELFYLHGGSLYSADYQPPAAFNAKKLDTLWQIVSDSPREWNNGISYLNEFKNRADSSGKESVPLEKLRGSRADFAEKEPVIRHLLEQLHQNGIIRLRASGDGLEYQFTDPIYRYCALKAGNILELKTLLEARELLDNGAPFFHECLMGVSIDWDGKTNAPDLRSPETRNEIDVVAVHGIAPLFISCKNGTVDETELYKLHTVATRFAGPLARKMLIATELSQKNKEAITQRAEDMGVLLIPNAAELTKQQWREAFRKVMQ